MLFTIYSTLLFQGGWNTGQQVPTEEAVMPRRKHFFRKPDPLMLMTLLVSLGVFMTTAVDASESFFSNPNLPDLINGDITLSAVGHRGAGVHMSFQTPATIIEEEQHDYRNGTHSTPAPDIFLSVRIPW
jgi:hypothetical protein